MVKTVLPADAPCEVPPCLKTVSAQKVVLFRDLTETQKQAYWQAGMSMDLSPAPNPALRALRPICFMACNRI